MYVFTCICSLSIKAKGLKHVFCSLGPPSVPTLLCIDLTEDTDGAVNVTVSWRLSGRDSADFYLINITTNAPQTPYGGLLNITNTSVTQRQLTGFMAGYEYNITVRGVNCGGQVGSESDSLTITPQGNSMSIYSMHCMISIRMFSFAVYIAPKIHCIVACSKADHVW